MHALHTFEGRDWAFRQNLEEIHVLGREPLVCPDCGEGCNWIEAFYAFKTGTGLVMIAADKDLAQLARALSHLIGTSAVTDNIAQIEHPLVLRRSFSARPQPFQVALHVNK